MKTIFQIKSVLLLTLFFGLVAVSTAQSTNQNELDKRVQTFLDENRQNWHNLNVPFEDGQILHELIIKKNYKISICVTYITNKEHDNLCFPREVDIIVF